MPPDFGGCAVRFQKLRRGIKLRRSLKPRRSLSEVRQATFTALGFEASPPS